MTNKPLCNRCEFDIGNPINECYVVDKLLGEGTFGQVYRVKKASDQVYALKLLKLWSIPSKERDRLMKRFELEYETGKIPSNYLVRSHDWGVVEGNPYIVMEYCPGGDLQQAMQNGQIELNVVAQEILFGLRDLHRCGKVHRDLKPENVLIRRDRTAILTDFGISGDQNKRLTETDLWGNPKQMFGTYPYMPPEQINPKRGNATVLPTTDIFSFGVMIYRLLTGYFPFGTLENDADLTPYLDNVKDGYWDKERLINTTKNGVQWLAMIEGCLVPDFKKRLQTTEEVLSLLPQIKGKNVRYHSVDSSISKPNMQIINGILLRIMQGEEYGKEYKLNALLPDNCQIITMGRFDKDVYNRIAIKEEETAYISRCHCTLELDYGNGQWFIRDGQWRNNVWKLSLNGTYVNSQEVDMSGMPIKPGDIVSIGDVKLRVEGY